MNPLTNLTTQRIWRALHHPPRKHPLFWRTMRTRLILPDWFNERVRPAIYLFTVLLSCPVLVALSSILANEQQLLIGFIALILLNGTRQGLLWSLYIGDATATLHENQTYELLSTTPLGSFGVLHAIVTGCVYRDLRFLSANSMRRGISAFFFWMTLIFSATILLMFALGNWQVPTTAGSTGQSPFPFFFATTITMSALTALYYLDHAYAITIGVLVGIIIPTYTRTRTDTRLLVPGAYLFVQIVTYLPAWVVFFNILPALYNTLGLRGWLFLLLQAVLSMAVFIVLREGAVTLLWRHAIHLLNIQPSDLDSVSDNP